MTTDPNRNTANACCCSPAAAPDAREKAADLTFRPPMDLYELEDRYEVHLDVPGATPEQVSVTINDGVLSIEARVSPRSHEGAGRLHSEYAVGDYRRQVRLGEDIEEEALSATYTSGVLVLTLPKRARRQARRIEVRGAS